MTDGQKYHAAILTHESTHIPFEGTVADLLTQFFVGNFVRLHTSILVEGMCISVPDLKKQKADESPEVRKRKVQESSEDTLVLVDFENVHGTSGYKEKVPSMAHYLKEDVPTTAHFAGRGRTVT